MLYYCCVSQQNVPGAADPGQFQPCVCMMVPPRCLIRNRALACNLFLGEHTKIHVQMTSAYLLLCFYQVCLSGPCESTSLVLVLAEGRSVCQKSRAIGVSVTKCFPTQKRYSLVKIRLVTLLPLEPVMSPSTLVKMSVCCCSVFCQAYCMAFRLVHNPYVDTASFRRILNVASLQHCHLSVCQVWLVS